MADENKVRGWIKRAGLSLGKAAEAMGIDSPKMSRVLSGARTPQIRELVKLAKAIGVPLQILLNEFGMDELNEWGTAYYVTGTIGELGKEFEIWIQHGPNEKDLKPETWTVETADEVHLYDPVFSALDVIGLPAMGYAGQIVRVVTDALSPRYLRDEHIGFTRVREDDDKPEKIELLIGQEAIVFTQDGRSYLRRLSRGTEPGTFTLISWNPQVPPLLNQRLYYAARIDFHIPGVAASPDDKKDED